MPSQSEFTVYGALTRRQWLKSLSVASMGVLLAACSPAAAPAPASPTEAPEAAGPADTAEEASPTEAPAEPTAAPKQAVTIRYHARTGTQGDYFQQQADAFGGAQSEVKVIVEQTPGGEYEQKLTTLVAGGELGDGFWAAPFVAFYPFSARGICVDVSPLAEADGFDLKTFFPATIEQLTWQQKLTGWPMGAHPGWTAMFTNLDAWDAAGAPLPTWEWTYDKDWLPAVKAATVDKNGDGEPEAYGFLFDYNPQGSYTFIKSWGGDWIDPQGLDKSQVTSEATAAALMYMHDLVYKHHVSPTQEAIVENMFQNEMAASYANGIWTVSTMASVIQDKFKWQAFGMPAGPGGRGSFVGLDTLCISKSSKEPKAVFQWHKWLTTKEAGLAQMDAGFTPAARFDVWEDPKLANDPNYQSAYQWMQVARPCTFPGNARVTEFSAAFTQGLQAFMLEKDNPEAKLQELDRAVQDILDKPSL